MPEAHVDVCVVQFVDAEPDSAVEAYVPASQAAHTRSAVALQPTIFWPAAHAEVVQLLGQAVNTAVAKVEAVAAELNVPAAHALHTRSAVAFEATL